MTFRTCVIDFVARLTQGQKCHYLGRYDHREGHEMQPRQHLRQPFEVSTQMPKPSSPAETSLHHPAAPRQQREPLHRIRFEPRCLGNIPSLIAPVASPRPYQLNLRALLLIGWHYFQGTEQAANCVHRNIKLQAHIAAAAIYKFN